MTFLVSERVVKIPAYASITHRVPAPRPLLRCVRPARHRRPRRHRVLEHPVLGPPRERGLDVVPVAFPGTTHAMLYDPSQPNSFLVGGIGFLGRVLVTGPATATTFRSRLPSASSRRFPSTAAWLVVCDSGSDQMLRVDPISGGILPITSGAEPWGVDLNCGLIDPNTGDIYAGGLNAIWRIPNGSSTPVAFASGWGVSSYVSGLAIDPFSVQVVATLLQVNRFVRIDSLGTLTNISPSGSMPGPNAVSIDQTGDFVVAASFGNTYRVPHAGGSPVLIGTPTGILGAATWLSAKIEPFQLTATGPGGGAVALALGGVPPGPRRLHRLASFDTSLPLGAGPIFGFNPDALSFSLILAFPTASPGNPVHWSWPVSPPNYPAVPFVAPPGTVPVNSLIDFIAVGVNAGGYLRPTPVVRLMVKTEGPERSRRALVRDGGESSCDTAAGHGRRHRRRGIGSSALRAGGPGSDAPAPRRFAARWPVRVSRAYARDGQAKGLRSKSTTSDRRLRPAPRRESERMTRANLEVTLRCTRRGGRDRNCTARTAGFSLIFTHKSRVTG